MNTASVPNQTATSSGVTPNRSQMNKLFNSPVKQLHGDVWTSTYPDISSDDGSEPESEVSIVQSDSPDEHDDLPPNRVEHTDKSKDKVNVQTMKKFINKDEKSGPSIDQDIAD